ncbi:hypothetical protein [Thermostichus sp. MS-CIW-41]
MRRTTVQRRQACPLILQPLLQPRPAALEGIPCPPILKSDKGGLLEIFQLEIL